MHRNLEPLDIHICLISDDRYMIHTSVVISSVLSNSNPRDKYHFYILSLGINQKNKSKIEKLRHIRDFTIAYPETDPEKLKIFEKLKHPAGIPISATFRLLIPDLLPNVDKVIYLDSDLVVLHDIGALFAISVEDCWIAGVEDLNYRGLVKRLGYENKYPYINAGIYLVNMKAMRENNYYDKMLTSIEKEYKNYVLYDQCALNSAFHEHIKLIPHKWNMYHIFLNRPWYVFQPYNLTAWHDGFRNPGIVHFVGPDKPWKYNSSHPYKREYLKYLTKTPYRKLILINRVKYFWHITVKSFMVRIIRMRHKRES